MHNKQPDRQAGGEPAEALELFLRVQEEHADAVPQTGTAAECAAQLLAVSGRREDAATVAGRSSSSALTRHRLYLECSLCIVAGRYIEAIRLLAGGPLSRPRSDRGTLRESLLLCLLHELAGDASRAKRNLEVLERTFSEGPLWRWVLPVSYLLGNASADDLREKTRGFALFDDLTSSSLFYMLALVARARGDKEGARQLFRMTVESDPFNYWPAMLARGELKELSPGMRAFLSKA